MEVRQLDVNDLTWIVMKLVKRIKLWVLEDKCWKDYHGSDGRVRSALVKTKLKNSKDK